VKFLFNTMQINKLYRQGVNAIIVDKDSNFLLVQKNTWQDNILTIPGGGKENDETPEENLFRELAEEIGAEKKDLIILGISSHNIEYDYSIELSSKINGGEYRGQSYKQFVVRFIGDKDKLIFTPKEFRNHKWVKAQELHKYLVLPNQYKTHKQAINEILPGIIQ